jgi:hypothetical protein
VERKSFLAMMSAVPIIGCSRATKLPEPEQESMLFTTQDLNNLLDVYAGTWWRDGDQLALLKLRDYLWRKTMTFTNPENQEKFTDAYLDDFLNDIPLIAYKYFIKGSDVSPEDIPRLKEQVKRSIR